MSMRYQANIMLPGYNPLKVANAPTIGTATAGSSLCASVTFTAPACVGGGAISSYTVFSNCGAKLTTGASSPLVVTGLTDASSYTFKVIATNAYGPSYPSVASNSITASSAGQQAYTSSGSYTWVAPTGVTSVSIVVVGAGGNGGVNGFFAGAGQCRGGGGGGGGGLGYLNNYSVTPSNSYNLVVRAGGAQSTTYFVGSSTVGATDGTNGNNGCAGGGAGAGGSGTGTSATKFSGGCAGNGTQCNTIGGGGGGAAGYAGAGGNYGSAGAGGGGGGGFNSASTGSFSGGGGGVGILGQSSNGAAGTSGSKTGKGGSGGANAGCANGGAYGGGGAGKNGTQGTGASGAVRIIWPGSTRSFPSTCTGNL